MKKSALAAVAAAALGLAALSGCSSSGSSSSEPSASMVGGMTECTQEALQSSVDEAAKALGAENVLTDPTLNCADGWAVVAGTLGPANAPADGPQGAPTSFIFEQEGQFWIPKDKASVCGTMSGDTYPSDAQVPEALYTAGCLSG